MSRYKIIKTKFLCKTDFSTAHRTNNPQWKIIFKKDKWYDGEYETWGFNRDMS